MGTEHVELTPDAEELLAELATAFEKRAGERRPDEVTAQMVVEKMRANGAKASPEKVRVGLLARVEAGELVVRRVGRHTYFSRAQRA